MGEREISGRYRIEAPLGAGGMAAVHSAIDLLNGRRVALKRLRKAQRERTSGAEIGALFELEYRTLAELKHPRVIAVYDYGVDEGEPWYTMELLDGVDLTRNAPLPWRDACRIMFDVCSSLALLHSRGLLHRDVSARNVRCTSDGHAKLIDFGAMSQMGYCRQVVGTPPFVAPEVVHRLALDGRSDLFSVGATLYFALTGAVPFPARRFAELPELWQVKPRPPSLYAPGIPQQLDLLTLSLINIDPAQRPRSVHDVMERLAGLAGITALEPLSVKRAYFTAPALVGRASALAAVRTKLEALRAGRGSALLIHARPGEGRSRMLDAAVLEAKTAGGAVLRANVRSAAGRELGAIQALTDALLDDLPHVAEAALPPDSPLAPLLAAGPRPRLVELGSSRSQLQSELREWLLAIGATQPLAIAVDDVHEADASSLALLAALANDAASKPLALLFTAETASASGSLPETAPLAVLAAACEPLPLRKLEASETEALLRSIFGDVPNLSLLSARVHASAAGNPRDCMDLIQDLSATGQLLYQRGHWTLPSELASLDLPASAEEAFVRRLPALTPLARRLLEAQALATHAAFVHDDYVQMEPEHAREIVSALAELLAEQMLESDGTSYVFARGAFANAVAARLRDDERRERERAIARMYDHKQRELVAAQHYLLGGDIARGLDRLVAFSKRTDDTPGQLLREGVTADEAAEVFERGLSVAASGGRTRLEIAELRHWLVMLGTNAADRHYHGSAAEWFAEIERDSGLRRWRELSDVTDAGDRLTRALVFASEQYQATPEAERVYAPPTAIQYLVHYVAASLALGVRTSDGRLLAALPPILEPFAPLSPLIYAVWQNALATYEISCACQFERARERYRDALARLPSQAPDTPTQYVRNAMVYALGLVEARLGIESAEDYIEQLDAQHGPPGVDAMYLRKVMRLCQGDFESAELCRRSAELLALRENARPMLAATLGVELSTHVLANDLTGIQHVKERIVALASRYEGWRAFAHLAEAQYLRACGRAEAAIPELEAAIAAAAYDPADRTRVTIAWPAAVSTYVDVLQDLGRDNEALQCGEGALQTCRELGSSIAAHGIIRSLALVHAKLGDAGAASEQLERLIEEQRALGVRGLQLGATYEARTRVALRANDPSAIARYGQLTAAEYRNATGSALLSRYESLLSDAERHGAGELPALSDLRSTAGIETQ